MTIKSKLSDKDRNQPCPCGSGLKQKKCHGDPEKLQMCNHIAQHYMVQLIVLERKECGLEPFTYTCEKCGKGTDQPKPCKLADNILLCSREGCDGVLKTTEKTVEQKETESKIILES